MNSLWTPDGERPVEPNSPQPPAGPPPGDEPVDIDDLDPQQREELLRQMQELQAQLASVPAEDVIANHAYGLFELATLHLALQPPQLDQAALAIDALGGMIEAAAGRLGVHEEQLTTGLAQIRLAFVQIQAGAEATTDPSGGDSDGDSVGDSVDGGTVDDSSS